MDMENNIPVTLRDRPERTLDIVAAEIRGLTAGMLNNVIEIGRRMVEAKEMLPYGQFGTWIKENTGYSVSTANNFMNLYLEYGSMQGSLFGAETESQTFGKLTYSKALALLAVPAEEREAFAVEADAEHTSVRELKRKVEQYQRERDEALQKAESARVELETTEEDLLNSNRANDRLRKELEDAQNAPPDGLWLATMREEERKDAEAKVAAQLAESEQARAKAEADAKAAADEAAEVRKRLRELEKQSAKNAKKAEEAHKADKSWAVEQARTEAVAELQAKLDKANAALDEANAAAKEAAAAESALRQELAEARKAASESEAAPVEDKDISEFRFLFNQAQETANKMRKIMLKYHSSADGAKTAGQLSLTIATLGDFIKEAAKCET